MVVHTYTLRRLRQKDATLVKVRLGYVGRPCLKKKKGTGAIDMRDGSVCRVLVV